MLEIHALERIARLAQRQVERQIVAMAFGLGWRGYAGTHHHLLRRAAAEARRRMAAAFLDWRGHHRTRRGGRRAHGFLRARQALLHRLQQFLQGNRLFQEIQCADACRFHRRIDRGVARHHDDRHGQQAIALPFLEQGHAVGIGHPDIQQYQVGRTGGTRFACLLRIFGQLDSMPFVAQYLREQLTDTHFIIHYEYVCHSCLAFLISPPCAPDRHAADNYDFISVLHTKPDAFASTMLSHCVGS